MKEAAEMNLDLPVQLYVHPNIGISYCVVLFGSETSDKLV